MPRFFTRAVLALSVFVVGALGVVAIGPIEAESGESWTCSSSLGGNEFWMGQHYSQSGWRKMTDDATSITGIEIMVESGADGHRLNLTSDWSSSAIFQTITVPPGGGVVPIDASTSDLIGFFIPPEGVAGSPNGLQATINLCTGGGDPAPQPEPDPDPAPDPDPVPGPDPHPIPHPGPDPHPHPGPDPDPQPGPDPDPQPDPDPHPHPDPGPDPHPQPDPGDGIDLADNFNQPQVDVPSAAVRSASFGHWIHKLDDEMTARIGQRCVDLHDRFWVTGPDGDAYHTWHPASYDGCEFGHEHGDDAGGSDSFDYAGGYPPFGFAMSQQGVRHEDHFGHKITVANDIRLSIGLSSGENDYPNIYDSGITCDWMSKIHQGSYAADALTNHLHEYFLTVRCDDVHQGANTEFSVKLLAPFGNPNQFDYAGLGDITDVMANVESQITNIDGSEIDAVKPPHLTVHSGEGGGRGVSGFPALQWHPMHNLAEPELWSMHSDRAHVETPNGGGVKFAPYYIIKNMARTLDPQPDGSFDVVRTVDLCYSGGTRVPGPYCSALPETQPADDYWKSTDSPFNGSMRAVQFKGFGLTNDGGPEFFCTDPFGKSATAAPCGDGQVPQRASQIRNWWQEQSGGVVGNPGWTCITDVDGVCHHRALGGSVMKARYIDNNGVIEVVNGGLADPYINGNGQVDGYEPAGIGHEWVVDYSQEPGLHAPN